MATDDMLLTDTDLAWAAGVFDGEGCVSVIRWEQRKGDGPIYLNHVLTVTVVNTDIEMLKKLQKMFGGSIHCRSKRDDHPREIYSWQANSGKRLFLETIRPFSITKARQIDIALEFLEVFILTSGKHLGRGSIPLDDVAIRDSYVEALKELK